MAQSTTAENQSGGSRGRRIVLWMLGVVCGGCLLLCGGCLVRLWHYSDPKNQITVGLDTTVIDGPLTVDGFIDYEAALNQRLAVDVTTENNAVVPLVRYFQLLGITQLAESGAYFVDMDEYVRKQNPDPSDLGDRIQSMYDAQGAAALAPWTEAEHPELAALLADI
jgi:hypothetical protein